MIEAYKTFKGWIVRKWDGIRWLYMAKGNKYVTDYTYAKAFSEKAANELLKDLILELQEAY